MIIINKTKMEEESCVMVKSKTGVVKSQVYTSRVETLFEFYGAEASGSAEIINNDYKMINCAPSVGAGEGGGVART